MGRGSVWVAFALCASCVPAALASSVEKIHNDKVVVTEDTLAPGEAEAPAKLPSMVVYLANGTAEIVAADGASKNETVTAGETVFEREGAGTIKNVGSTPLHFTRIEFLTMGSGETWGMSGLPPNYKMLLENKYARAYDIRIPPKTFEQRHTHHARVVVALSGATLEHILPDGTHQPSTLKTGEIVWRGAATHTGHNMGNTPLWCIAVEPK